MGPIVVEENPYEECLFVNKQSITIPRIEYEFKPQP